MGSVRVRPESKCLFFDFQYLGQRCREQTTLKDSPANRKKMRQVLTRIETEIALGSFQYRSYFPNSSMALTLGDRFSLFDGFRARLNATTDRKLPGIQPANARERTLLNRLSGMRLVEKRGNRYRLKRDPKALRFITGGWLENLTASALFVAGADEVLQGQKLSWQTGPYRGYNEIDAIGRRGNKLVFVSCKAVSAFLKDSPGRYDGKKRRQLMRYLDETDNLVDHFGRAGDQAVLVVSTDLLDEHHHDRARYPALFGKALALDVHLLTLEDLHWSRLVNRMKKALHDSD